MEVMYEGMLEFGELFVKEKSLKSWAKERNGNTCFLYQSQGKTRSCLWHDVAYEMSVHERGYAGCAEAKVA